MAAPALASHPHHHGAQMPPMEPVPARYFARLTDDPLRSAFTRRPGPHAGAARHTLQGDGAAACWQALLEQSRHGPTAAYVHVPFCEGRCAFCMFYQAHLEQERVTRYLGTLLAQLDTAAAWPAVHGAPIDCLYLGGGTPTALSAADLHLVLGAARRNLPLVDGAEITVEGRIHGFDDAKIDACLLAGANRFSLGVQTFDTAIRRGLGRRDEQPTVIARLQHLCGVAHRRDAAVVIDLIFGLPGQYEEKWRSDLEIADALPLDGLDLYALKMLPGSPLTRRLEAEGIDTAGLYARQAELFAFAVAWLSERGWERISISHWRRGPRERNVYNMLIHTGADCLGFGPGAGSTLQGHGCSSSRDVDAWCNAAAWGGANAESLQLPAPLAALQATLRAQLEALRIELPEAAIQVPGFDLVGVLGPLLTQWRQAGLLVDATDAADAASHGPHRYRLTLAGQFWSTNLLAGLAGTLAAAAVQNSLRS